MAHLLGCAGARGGERPPAALRSTGDVAEAPALPLTPLYLEAWVTVHGSASGPLVPEMPLRSGDRIGLEVRPSCVSHVSMIHCGLLAPLSMFPPAGSLRVGAGERVQLPAAGMQLRVGDEPGWDTLYIIAAKEPLARVEPALYEALMHAQASAEPADCGALEQRLAGSNPVSTRQRFTLRGVELSHGQHAVARAFAGDDGVVALRFPFHHTR